MAEADARLAGARAGLGPAARQRPPPRGAYPHLGPGPAHAYHLLPAGVSKAGTAAAYLAGRGLDRAQVAAIGDSPADLELAGVAGAMFLVANGAWAAGLGDPAHPGDRHPLARRPGLGRSRQRPAPADAGSLAACSPVWVMPRRLRIRSTVAFRNARMHLEHTGSPDAERVVLPRWPSWWWPPTAGPVQFEIDDDGNLSSGRGAGGMVTALGPALAGQAGTWVAAAISDGDRVAARRVARSGRLRTIELAQGPVRLRSLVFDPREYQSYYNRVANRTIWFLHHYLFDVPRHPRFDRGFRVAWQHYEGVNQAFAAACDDEADHGGEVFVQDYHLALVPAMLRQRRPDLRVAHFSHCPWADPGYFLMLPGRVAEAILEGMLGADLLGFLVPRWARNFLHCCLEAGFGVDFERHTVRAGDGRTVQVRTYPLGVDGDALQERAAQPDARAQGRAVAELARGRRLIVRVDRLELSKNILRGLEGYGMFLERNPRARGRVVHYALTYPSRRDLPEYQAYTAEVKHLAESINERFRTRTWEPVLLDLRDNYPRALAAMAAADVLIVNPVWDGMNLVAKEGPVISRRDLVLILSRNAGAADDLGAGALLVNPFDTAELAETIATALELPPDERAKRAALLREGATALPPQDWFAAQREQLAGLAQTPRVVLADDHVEGDPARQVGRGRLDHGEGREAVLEGLGVGPVAAGVVDPGDRVAAQGGLGRDHVVAGRPNLAGHPVGQAGHPDAVEDLDGDPAGGAQGRLGGPLGGRRGGGGRRPGGGRWRGGRGRRRRAGVRLQGDRPRGGGGRAPATVGR